MKHSQVIDNDDIVFQFDPYEYRNDSNSSPMPPPPSMSSCPADDRQRSVSPRASARSLVPHDPDGPQHQQSSTRTMTDSAKGKGVILVEPLSIPPIAQTQDLFDSSTISRFFALPDSEIACSSFHSSHVEVNTQPADDRSLSHLSILPGQHDGVFPPTPFSDKGKGRDIPPTLPPLSFSPTELSYSSFDWPCPSSPGPSSYGSNHTSLFTPSLSQSQSNTTQQPDSLESGSRRRSPSPSLRRSQSNFSICSTPSMAKFKFKLGPSSKTPGNVARKLFGKNKGDVPDTCPTETEPSPLNQSRDELLMGPLDRTLPWQTLDDALKPLSADVLEQVDSIAAMISETPISWDPTVHRFEPVPSLKDKGRSYSSPFPTSAFDIVPQLELNVFLPLSFNHVRNIFDEVLPTELRLQIFRALIKLHEEEHEQLIRSRKWTALKASSSKNRWVGRDRAMRELVKLSRVSKTWRSLVFDGQLWEDVDLQAFPKLSALFLAQLAENIGPFVKHLDLSGHTGLASNTLVDMTNSLCVRSAPTLNFTYTQLTVVNLQGCTNLTTQSLHGLLIRSPLLRSLCVKGLRAVTNATFDVLALCQHLTSLNMDRCIHIDGEGLRAFGAAILSRGACLALKEFRLSGIQGVFDDALATLGKAAPDLEVLDLSYCLSLHNSALAALVSCTEEDRDKTKTISLTAREAGMAMRDSRRYIRRVTALRHLSLSHCPLLTDIACSNLAYALPRLEFLELAGIGGELHDDGLVKLLKTTPLLRRLDLEDASSITDAVLTALTPMKEDDPTSARVVAPLQTGHALEHLVVSHSSRLSNDAFSALIHGCSQLRLLEADSTLVSGSVVKEFVCTSRERRIKDAHFIAVDCRLVGESVVKDVTAHTRPRRGWRSWQARKLGYLDGRDGEDLKVGQDECDEERVVLKSFYNWQTVDAVKAARDRRRKATKKSRDNESSEQVSELEGRWTSRMKWWSPSRRSSGNNTPGLDDSDRDGCTIM
ncbi:RNI-like protein [Pisolithus marmoratus]|nr:RNI-like protein [Pisolithus marmoratus]